MRLQRPPVNAHEYIPDLFLIISAPYAEQEALTALAEQIRELAKSGWQFEFRSQAARDEMQQ